MMRNETTKILIPNDKNSICRICLQVSNDLINVNNYSPIEWPNAGRLTIAEVFKKLSLKVDYAEYLPNGICCHCIKCLEEYFLFVEKIESNEELLRLIYSEDVTNTSEDEGEVKLSSKSYNESYKSHNNENSLSNIIAFEHDYVNTIEQLADVEKCVESKDENKEDANLNLASKGDRVELLVKKPRTSTQKYEVPSENSSETDSIRSIYLDINLEKNKEHQDSNSNDDVNVKLVKYKSQKQMRDQEDEPTCIKQCFFCDRKFSNDDLRVLHYIDHVAEATAGLVPQRLFCTHCGLLSITQEELNEHINSEHQNKEESSCQNCNIRFSNVAELQIHLEKNHIEDFEEEIDGDIKCLLCKKCFANSNEMMIHSLEHLRRRYRCRKCKTSYICSAALNEHHKTDPQYNYKCPICKMWICSGENSFEEHMETHSTTKKYECQLCPKKYKTKFHFHQHLRSHNGTVHTCPDCSYTTRFLSDFNIHLRVHSNEHPFKCTFKDCGKTFGQNSSLKKHENDHFKIRKFSCELCSYKTSRFTDLSRHQKVHRASRLFDCKICGRFFVRQLRLTRHMKKMHPEL
ncbi:zinc finger protein 20-like [Harmonia axyridis]|uniref:zinc finger protein 20-like n=1 Tax=Harmonia axyridis TaxID=115357 RepID=UPI001E278069|nr:zinc finger protein 20-like [Harmonia axyridis]